MVNAQLVKTALIDCEFLLAREAVQKLGTVEVPTEDLQALVDEVKRDQSRIDQVKQLYDGWDNFEGKDYIYSSQTIAAIIADVLLILNIKIEGVNVYEG